MRPVHRLLLAAGALSTLCSPVASAQTEAEIDAIALARTSLGHLESAGSIAVDVEVAEEAMLSNGLKIRAYRAGNLAMQRTPGNHGFVFTRRGAMVDQTMSFDGSHLYMTANKAKAMAKIDAEGTVDDVMDSMVAAGAYLPGRDLLYTDAADGLLEDVMESHYEGIVPLGGKSCHYTVFRGPDVDWHLWVDQETELPCKYMITSKWTAGAPEFELTFSNWVLDEEMSREQFVLTAPDEFIQLTSFSKLQPDYSK
jgi:hypothetical protein